MNEKTDEKNSSEKEQNTGSGTTIIQRVIEDEIPIAKKLREHLV